MPCSFCNCPDHNISKCYIATIRRTISIWNLKRDCNYSRNLNAYSWFKSNGQHFPSDSEWRTTAYGNHRPAEMNVLYLLDKIHRMKYTPTFPDYYIWKNDNHVFKFVFIRNPSLSSHVNDLTLEYTDLSNNPDRNSIVYEFNTLVRGMRYTVNHPRPSSQLSQSNGANSIRQQQQQGLQQQREQINRQRLAQQREQINRQRLLQQRRRERRANEEAQTQQEISRFERELKELSLVEKVIECDDCPICMDGLGDTNKMVLRCGHQFCGDCILNHFQREGGTKCPACRTDFAVRVPNWLPPTTQSSFNTFDQRPLTEMVHPNALRQLVNMPLDETLSALHSLSLISRD